LALPKRILQNRGPEKPSYDSNHKVKLAIQGFRPPYVILDVWVSDSVG
jgi:hypothetical protein